MDPSLWPAHAESDERHWWFTARREIIMKLAAQVVPPSNNALALDVGCGTGGNTQGLSQLYSATGIDPSSEAIAIARQRYPNIEFRCGDAIDVLCQQRQQARLILLADVLEHIDDDLEFFSNLVHNCQADTFFLITVPADQRLWSQHDVAHHHYRRYDIARLRKVWEDQPVECLLLSPFNSRLYPLIRAIRAWNGLIPWRTESSDLSMPPRLINRALHRIFAGESRRLLDLITGKSTTPGKRGVSIVAVLRRL